MKCRSIGIYNNAMIWVLVSDITNIQLKNKKKKGRVETKNKVLCNLLICRCEFVYGYKYM